MIANMRPFSSHRLTSNKEQTSLNLRPKKCLLFLLMLLGVWTFSDLDASSHAQILVKQTVMPQSHEWPVWEAKSVEQLVAGKSQTPDAPMSPEPFLTIDGDRMSAWLERRPLSWVIQEVMARSQVTIKSSDRNFDRIPVSVKFKDLPLEEGLSRLLSGVDAFYFYRGRESARGVLRTIWVYPRGQGERLSPVSPESWASTREIEETFRAGTAAQRIRALDAIIERRGDQAEEHILKALRGTDESVRYRALQSAFNAEVVLPVDALGELLQFDALPQIRSMALSAIVSFWGHDRERSRWLVEQALRDRDEAVQAQAKAFLADMDAADQADGTR